MNRLLLFAVVGVGLWYVWRTIGRKSREVVNTLRQAEATLSRKAPVTLERDPVTGVYRPAKQAD
jgi:hypothetical protein